MANKWTILKKSGEACDILSIRDASGQPVTLSLDPDEQQILEAKFKGGLFIRRAQLDVRDKRFNEFDFDHVGGLDVGLAITEDNELILYGAENEIICTTMIQNVVLSRRNGQFRFVDDQGIFRRMYCVHDDDLMALKRVLRRHGVASAVREA